uniref:Ammonium transporter AmtB-like domain-containing protein n=1 Tax=Leersia perrieri TaxID=77586 RepID=A0A0D9XVV5_9ORYZ
MASGAPTAAVPSWLNKGDNAWQMLSATLVGLQGFPGLSLFYAGAVPHRKWALTAAFMPLYAMAAAMPCWVLWAHNMGFGRRLLPFVGRPGPALTQDYMLAQALLPSTLHLHSNGDVETAAVAPLYPSATMVFFQWAFAGVTVGLVAGAVLGRMSVKAWMAFVPVWTTLSYTVGAYSIWGGGFLFHWGVMDYSGGYVVHLAAGVSGYTAAYWVGPPTRKEEAIAGGNNLVVMLAGAGILWMGWTGFNGGEHGRVGGASSPGFAATWPCAGGAGDDHRPGVCITPAAGLVQGWAALVMGVASGTLPWYTINAAAMIRGKVEDTLGILHTHAVSGVVGGVLTGVFAHPTLCDLFLPVTGSRGLVYGVRDGGVQVLKQVVAALFVAGWNVAVTSVILVVVRVFVPLRMTDEELLAGDIAVREQALSHHEAIELGNS